MSRADGTSRRLGCAALLALAASACDRPETAEPAPQPVPAPAQPSIPTPPPPLGRAELLDAVRAAASAAATSGTYPEAAAGLEGRRFTIRLPLGCWGPEERPRLGYAWNPERRTLRLTAQPEVWTEAAWARDLVGGETVESIEGFWLRRPWTDAETCPPRPAPEMAAIPPAPETVGLAQAFGAEGSRLLRRGDRPYEVTRKLDEGQEPSAGGYRLVLEGRVVGPQPIACRSSHPDVRPVCLVRVELGRVAFEDATGQMLAEWRS